MTDWLGRARACRAADDMAGADAAAAAAVAAAPDDPAAAMLLAQLRFERGLDAAPLFAHAAALDPGNRDAVRNHALALAAQGDRAAAEAALDRAIARWPDWLDGLRVRASLRWQAGDHAGFDAGWADAVRARPQHAGLWLGWFGACAQTRDWARARAVLDAATAQLGETRALLTARAFMTGESGDLDACAALLAQLGVADDPFLQVAAVRLALRRHDAARARDAALAMLHGPAAAQAWSYLGTAWRMLDDPRADWLDGDPAFVRTHRVALAAADLAELAAVLRALHAGAGAYAEQSVRHGTQTDRSVLLRHEPVFDRVRAALMEAVAAHVAALPPPDPQHPLLARARHDLRLAGSWSVRLTAGGHNVTHCHPLGWLSSAFYVACDPPAVLGAPPAGHFHWGAPPDELGLDLPPRGLIAPEPGMLVLFPSTTWHGTVPTTGGERLAIAFDVVPR